MIALVLVTAVTLLAVAGLVTLGAHIDQRALQHDGADDGFAGGPR